MMTAVLQLVFVVLFTLSILLIVPNPCMGYGQSLQDCKAVAALFNNTCNRPNFANPPELIDDMLSETVYCPEWDPTQGPPACIGTVIDDICTWERKLCVTCEVVDQVTMIRIQTNNMPNHCVNSGQVSPQNFDFEVAFNYPLTYGDWVKEMLIQSRINVNVCSIVKATPDEYEELIRLNELTEFSQESANAMGFMTNGVALQFANQMQEDPVFPISVFNEQPLDICIGHNQRNNPSGMYHYHHISPCIVEGFLDNRTMGECDLDDDCSSGIVNYQLSAFQDLRYKTVVGIAKDGHILYGPYRDDGLTWEPDEVDICNGAWTDDLEEFFYPGTHWHPYGPGCLGSANFAHLDLGLTPECSNNGIDMYLNPTSPPDPCDNDFSLTLLTDEYGSETSWTVTDSNDLVLLSGDNYNDSLYYTVEECLPTSDCYTFTIFDSYGDGICCDYGEGQYSIEYNGATIANGGEFEDSEVTTFGTVCSLTGSNMPSEYPTIETSSPTNPPTSLPTTENPTTLSPTSLPTSTPSGSQTVACNNSPYPIAYDTLSSSVTCLLIAAYADSCFCLEEVIQSHCPVTCNTCDVHACVDSEADFYYGTFIITCIMVQNLDPAVIASACLSPDVSNTCRATCGTCSL